LCQIICGGLALFVAACNSPAEQTGEDLDAQPDKSSGAAEHAAAPRMHMKDQIVWSIRDLSQSRSVAPESITLVNARPVTWRSGAVGCPEPGMSYSQALVPGVSILLRLGEEILAYHAVVGGEPFHCPLERVEAPIYGEDSDQV
jgi:hypothetical protein